jgi:hypothetical protein
LGSLFAFNDQLREGIKAVPTDLQLSLNDTETYLRTTQEQVDGVMITSYRNLSDALICILGENEPHDQQIWRIYSNNIINSFAFNSDDNGIPRSVNPTVMKFQELKSVSQKLNGQDFEIMDRNLNLTIESLSEYCASNTCEEGTDFTKVS